MERRTTLTSLAGCALVASLASLSPLAAGAQTRTEAPPDIVRPSRTIEVIPLNYADARDVADVLNVLYRGEITASAFPQTNALLVNLSPAGSAAAPQAQVAGRYNGPAIPTGFPPMGGIRPLGGTIAPPVTPPAIAPQNPTPFPVPEQTNR